MKTFPLKKIYLGLLVYSSFLIRKHNSGRQGELLKQQHLGVNLQGEHLRVVALVIYESFTGKQREVLMWALFRSVVSG